MDNQDTYKNKIQNMFTGYVVKSLGGARKKYLAKKHYRESMENYLEDDMEFEPVGLFDDYYTVRERERLLEAEIQGSYPDWNELSNDHLVRAIQLLKKEERDIIFRHVFQEKSFEEMSEELGIPQKKLVNRYYYAIKKIRYRMRGE